MHVGVQSRGVQYQVVSNLDIDDIDTMSKVTLIYRTPLNYVDVKNKQQLDFFVPKQSLFLSKSCVTHYSNSKFISCTPLLQT